MMFPPIDVDPDADKVVKLNTPFKAPAPDERYLVVPPSQCLHFQGPFLVDDTLAEVTCGQCNQKLNPMFVLKQLVQKESRWFAHFARYQGEMKRLAERSRTKCRKCGEITPISHA